jgi:hypothetical protein
MALKIALALAVAQWPMSLVTADEFPLIYWHQAIKPPLSVSNGFSAPSCADTEGSDGDLDCKIISLREEPSVPVFALCYLVGNFSGLRSRCEILKLSPAARLACS